LKNYSTPPFGNTTVSWNIYIRKEYKNYKVCKADNYSDGEKISPVLTNNILVTESIPLWVRENSTKEYTFENLKVILPQVYASSIR
jgi:hypothetical protein